MKIFLYRYAEIDGATLGTVFVISSGECPILFACNSLEPKQRDVKVKGETAIPPGTYKVKYSYSPKFGKEMPYLEGVPNFSGVMFHVGNELKDTEGCILLGLRRFRNKAFVYNSKVTFELFNTILQYEKGDITVTIVDNVPKDK